MFVYMNSVTGNHHIIGKYGTEATAPFAIYQSASQIGFYSSSNGTSWNLISNQTFGTGLSTGVWYHLAVSRVGTNWYTFRDGVLIATGSVSGTVRLNAGDLTIASNNSGAEGFNGYIDEIRLSNGVGRYSANFTVPTEAYPNY